MIRKNLRMRIARDMRGKITTGRKSEKGYPQSLEHFNIESFPELQQHYGTAPEKLVIYVPSNTIEDFFATEYNRWGAARSEGAKAIKTRSCDGELCMDHTTGEEKPCFCRELPAKQQCSCYMGMKAFVAGQDGRIVSPTCYQFESHSENTADKLYSVLLNVYNLTGGKLIGVPFVLGVQMIETLVDGEKKKFPIWDMQSLPSVNHIIKFSERGLIPARSTDAVPILTDGETPRVGKQKALEIGE